MNLIEVVRELALITETISVCYTAGEKNKKIKNEETKEVLWNNVTFDKTKGNNYNMHNNKGLIDRLKYLDK